MGDDEKRRSLPLDDGDRKLAWERWLFPPASPTVADCEYVAGVLACAPNPAFEAAIAADVVDVAADGDTFCLALRAGRLMRAFVNDTRIGPQEWAAGCGLLAVPCSFLTASDVHAYLIFRATWVRVWERVNRQLPAIRNSIIEGLQLELCSCCQATVSDAVTRWILCGFVGVLALSQVFVVWDRLIVSTTCPVPEFTSTCQLILRSRERAMTASDTRAHLQLVLSDLSDLDVTRLLRRPTTSLP